MNKIRILFLLVFLWSIVKSYAVPDSVGIEQRNGKRFIKHLVEKGETHFAISRRYDVNVKEIIELNPDTKGGLVAGTIIIVPYTEGEGKFHIVQPGETLFSIYRKYGIEVEKLKEINGLAGNEIQVGQKIKLTANIQEVENSEEEENIHIVSKGETLFSISRKYDIKWQDIKIYNGLESNSLSVGQTLGIPNANLSENQTEKEIEVIDTVERPEMHVVKPGQTLYSISKMYALNADEIIEWNDLLGPEIQIGQELSLKRPEKIVVVVKSDPLITEKDEYMKGDPKVKITNVGGHEKIIEKGMAQLIEGGSESNRFLALHKTAPVGTIMQVKNEINGYSVFVRVIGKLPDIGENKDVILKLTPRAFEALKGVDKKFMVELSWLP